MVLYQICVFGADLKSNMTARVHNVFSLAEILKIFLSETRFKCEKLTDGRTDDGRLPMTKAHMAYGQVS
jgi:hypothetical protein